MLFGRLDNIAWIWVHERDVKGKAGAELGLLEVGLGKKFVRKALTDNFRRLLDNRQKWLANLVNFRDSLAHRIPLYIPPYVVPKPNQEKYKELEAEILGEEGRDPAEYERLKAEQKTSMPICSRDDALHLRGLTAGGVSYAATQRLRGS